MMDKKRQKDFFPITDKESLLSSYVSPKEQAYQEFKRKEKLKMQQESEIEYDLIYDIFDYIISIEDRIKLPLFEVLDHHLPKKYEEGYIKLKVSPPKFPTLNRHDSLDDDKKEIYENFFSYNNYTPTIRNINDVSLNWYRYYFSLELDEGSMGIYGAEFTRLIGCISKGMKKKWRFKFNKQIQFHDLIEDSKGNFQFWYESSYRHIYYEKNKFEFDRDFSIIYQWNYPWYFSIQDEYMKEAGVKFWDHFIDKGLEY
tara:strand:+ start:1465 stop:2232 length:768 start_codon:yes stop_codon:yes gene_type:complete